MFQVLHSSAGAGKTHALVKHYLRLSLHEKDPSSYAHILALTFTNKAAGEMRERILTYLEGLAEGGPLNGALADVRDTISAAAGIPEQEVALRARATLTHMLHHWPRLAVSTIDAFTRRVVMPFARDLRLDQDLRMTTEEEYYRSKAVDLVLEEAGTDAALTELLVATCEQLIEEERAWRPDRALLELSRQLGREDALEHLAELRRLTNTDLLRMHRRLRERSIAFRERMRGLGRRAWQAIQDAGVTEKDLAYGKAGPYGQVRNLLTFDTWIKENKNVSKVLQTDKWTSGTAGPRTIAAVEQAAPTLRAVLSEVEAMRDGTLRDHAIASAIMRELMPTATLNVLEQRLEHFKQQEGIAFFSDLTRKVAAIVQDEPVSFLHERLGERYRHFLIDEFQDTSLLQWHALLPLIENALSTGGTALLVGDAKQAIYRWRNGEVRQFVLLPELFRKEQLTQGALREHVLIEAFTETPRLMDNHRSAAGIITFNNALVDVLKEGLHPDDRGVYHAHEQRSVRSDEGYVEVTCFAENDDSEQEEAPQADPASAYALHVVRECLQDGFRAGDIALLVRTKAQGRSIAGHLIAHGYEVVSPDGLALGGDIGTRALIAWLTWSLHRDDPSAAQAVQYIALLQAARSEVQAIDIGGDPRAVIAAWERAHPRIHVRLPLFVLLHRMAHALHLDPTRDAFVLGLLDEVHAFVGEHGQDVAGFLEHWTRTASRRSVAGSAHGNAVRIMTVHASKGLQFPVVIVPNLGRSARGAVRDLLWIKPEMDEAMPPSALVQLKAPLTGFGIPEVDEELRLRTLDELDILYVAFTRPEQRLYAGIWPKGTEPWAKAIREYLRIGPGEQWSSGERSPAIRKSDIMEAPVLLREQASESDRSLAIRREAPDDWDPADPDPFRAHGRMLHAVLAEVRTATDLPNALARARITDETAAARLEELVQAPELKPFFGEGLEVWTEMTLIDEEGHAWRPDRVVREGGLWRVLDIKTGAASDRHAEQVKHYATLIAKAEGAPAEAYLLYLRTGELIHVTR